VSLTDAVNRALGADFKQGRRYGIEGVAVGGLSVAGVRQAHGGSAMACPYGGEAVKTTEIHIRANQRPVDLICFIAANLDQVRSIIQGIEHDEDLRTLFPKK
jgi:hypothetical protein